MIVLSTVRSGVFQPIEDRVDKYLGKVYSQMNLLNKQFDRRCEEKEKPEELLSKAENQIAVLSQYTEFLTQKKYEKAKEHLEEVDKLEADIKKVLELFVMLD